MEIPETVWAEAKAAVFDMGHSEYWDDFQEVCECVSRAIMAERERAAAIAWEYEGKLVEYPDPEAKLFYEGGANDASTFISRAIRNPLHKQT